MELLCFTIIVIITLLTGRVFRGQYKKNQLANCLAMLVVMTMSTTIGIIIASWVTDMVLSTILSIIVSFVLTIVLTYKLPVMIMIESISMLFMGAMMGAMLSIMTTNYALLSLVFFTVVYIVSTIIAIGFWNQEEYPVFRKAVPFYFIWIATLAIFILVGTSIMTTLDSLSNPELIVDHHHH